MKRKKHWDFDVLKWANASDEFFDDAETIDVDREIQWLQNFQVIRDTIVAKSISLLPPIKGSALIIDKSMASTQFYKQLPNLKGYKGTIICCDRALYAVIPWRVPEYVVNVDISPLCFNFFDRGDVKEIMHITKAVFPITANPLTVRLWHGDRYFFTPLTKRTRTLALASNTVAMATGGQVASTAYVLACNLGAENIGLFGITHSYDSMDESEYPAYPNLHKRVEGPYGLCWQDPIYEQYNDSFLEFARLAEKKGINTINTSKSGLLYSENIEDMTLKEFVRKYK